MAVFYESTCFRKGVENNGSIPIRMEDLSIAYSEGRNILMLGGGNIA